ncbi:MAG: bifunctional tRNA (5-methylaminomethyl-2-thiouridine)(34)-methyltransferase MnmD/FAD-dependent 5-carboxymethylaminomethyl-2-thiouridine(34) oxidoreductase MnmC [Spirochaetota bacterium]
MQETSYEWRDGVLYSKEFSDVYHSKDGGFAEKEYVFLQGNQLEQRLTKQNKFVIFELGFGLGLNFFVTWKLWQNLRPKDAILHFYSVEKFPLPISVIQEQFRQAKEPYQQLLQEFSQQYQQAAQGMRKFTFSGNCNLFLYHGDFSVYQTMFHKKVDAWFLDGFSPSRNPELWNDTVLDFLEKHSQAETTFATYTVASKVRRGLQERGFVVEKRKGFANKREMMQGYFLPAKERSWFSYRKLANQKVGSALVIGAGLAGTSIAYALARKGWHITVVEKHSAPGQETSSNRAAMVKPLLANNGQTLLTRLVCRGFQETIEYLQSCEEKGIETGWKNTGVHQLLQKPLNEEKLVRCLEEFPELQKNTKFLSARDASAIIGQDIEQAAVFFQTAGFCNPRTLCESRLAAIPDKQKTLLWQKEITKLQKLPSGTWQTYTAQEDLLTETDIVILSNSHGANTVWDLSFLPFRRVRGQVCTVPAKVFTEPLRNALNFQAYLLPLNSQEYLLGATFNPYDKNPNVDPNHNQILLDKLQQIFPNTSSIDAQNLPAWVGFRSILNDHFPAVGPIPDMDFYREQYLELWKGKTADFYTKAEYVPGLYMLLGLGSKGVVYSQICANILASYIHKEKKEEYTDFQEALHPARFFIRDMIRRKSKG